MKINTLRSILLALAVVLVRNPAQGQSNLPPVITSQPQTIMATNASSVTFTVGVTGTGPLTYQWVWNGQFLPNSIITTMAGNGVYPNGAPLGDGGAATNATLEPAGLAVDASGNLFIADAGNQRIRKISPNGLITTIAGGGSGGNVGVAATNAILSLNGTYEQVSGVAVDTDENLFFGDTGLQRVGAVFYGYLVPVAGNGGTGFSGDGGLAGNAALHSPAGVAVDASGNVYFVDSYNRRIRKVDVNDVITTVAGNGLQNYAGNGVAATNAGLDYPVGVAVDPCGNLFVAEYSGGRIRRIDTNGIINTVAGNGSGGYAGDGGAATNAALSEPAGVAVDAYGNVFIADTGNRRIRKVDASGIITTVAGNGSYSYNSPLGDGGAATNASFETPTSVAVDAAGNLFISDYSNYRVRKVTPASRTLTLANVIATNAGNYQVIITSAYGSVTSSVATLIVGPQPFITRQPANQSNLSGGQVAFSVTATGWPTLAYQWQFNGTNLMDGGNLSGSASANLVIAQVSTNLAGLYDVIITNAWGSATSSVAALTIAYPPALTNALLSQSLVAGGRAIFSVGIVGTGPFSCQWRLNGTNLPVNLITTVAGNGNPGYSGDGGAATNTSLNYPYGVAGDSFGNLFIADYANQRIRKVDVQGIITTVAGGGTNGLGDGGPATNASLNYPYEVAIDSPGNLFIADGENNRIRKVDVQGVITTVAGNGIAGYSGDGGAATNAELNIPEGLAVDDSGNLFIADLSNQRIRKVTANGIISTVAGTGIQGYSGDGGAATNARLSLPRGVAVDGDGNVFIADSGNSLIRKVNTNGLITTVAGSPSLAGYAGDGGLARNAALNNPVGVALDGSGNLFIDDAYNFRIRKVDVNGLITTVAGNGMYGYSGDGGTATNTNLQYSYGMGVDVFGDLVIADSGNQSVREVNLAGPTLALARVTPANAGAYQVVVSSAWGSVTSSVINVTVSLPHISATPNPNGSVTLNLLTAPNASSEVQAATNLTPPVVWQSLGTEVPGTNGRWQFTATNASQWPVRFYRTSTP